MQGDKSLSKNERQVVKPLVVVATLVVVAFDVVVVEVVAALEVVVVVEVVALVDVEEVVVAGVVLPEQPPMQVCKLANCEPG